MVDSVVRTRPGKAEHSEVEVLWLPPAPEPKPRPGLTGALLVDAGDTAAMDGPLRVARLLARRDRVKVHVLAATLGPKIPTLASRARSDSASYVLGSLPPISGAEREESALAASHLAVEAATPILAVPSNVDRLPRSALAVVDLEAASVQAARATLPLLADDASLTLVHVVPSMTRSPLQAEAIHALRDLANELAAGSSVAVHMILLSGDPASVLVEWVSEFDLVALGASRGSALGSRPATSVSAVAFKHARGALLVAGGNIDA